MNSLLKSVLLYLLVGIIISIIIIIIVSIRKPFSIMKNVGVTFLVSGLAFIFLLFSKYFIPSAEGAVGELISNIINTFTYLYGIVFVAGIILTVVGYIGEKYSNEQSEKAQNMHSNMKDHKKNSHAQKSKKK